MFRVEAYLGRCVDSILGPPLRDFDLVLVDDGSPDRCGEICDAYANADGRVHVIHQKNAGLNAARNVGMEWALQNSTSERLFQDIRFPVGRVYEDEFTTCKVLFATDKIAFVNSPFYRYFIRNGGITRRSNLIDKIDALLQQMRFFKGCGKMNVYASSDELYISFLSCAVVALREDGKIDDGRALLAKVTRRLKNKNIAPFAGMTLLQYKISQLKKVKEIECMVFSSDSDHMLGLAAADGALVHKRAPEFCDEKTKSFGEVVEHICSSVEGEDILWATCTSPLVTPETYCRAIATYWRDVPSKGDSLASFEMIWRISARKREYA